MRNDISSIDVCDSGLDLLPNVDSVHHVIPGAFLGKFVCDFTQRILDA